MAITLNHTIVPARDKVAAARWFADIFGLEFQGTHGHFAPVRVNDELTLDFDDAAHFEARHLALQVSEAEFDAIFGRVQAAGLEYYSDPDPSTRGRINHRNGGRGVYFSDPNGHFYELLTRP